jgi:predicted TPR repeat methyltransferase
MGRVSNDHNAPGGISTRLVSFSAETADPPGVNDYDSFAEAYAAANENNLVNAYYERPAMLELAGDVAGRRILDAGCGSGPLFAALRDRGAIVTGIDKSAGMLELARRRLGYDADLQVAELGSPLPFPAGTFEDVCCPARSRTTRASCASCFSSCMRANRRADDTAVPR